MKKLSESFAKTNSNENASDKRSAGQKTIFVFLKPPLSEDEKDLNEIIAPTSIIASISTNEDQTPLAFLENSAFFE